MRVSVLSIGLASLFLASCSAESDALSVCESELLKTLRSPSTYKRIESTVSPPQFDPKAWVVSISYDADNAFGTPVRGGYLCAFRSEGDGSLPTKTAMENQAMEARLDVIEAANRGDVPDPNKLDVFPCCLSGPDKAKIIRLWLAGEVVPK